MAVKKTGYLIGAVAGAGVAAAALAGAGMQWPPAKADQAGLIKASTAPIFAPPPGAPMSFADIFDRVSPAVVSIDVTSSRVDRRALRSIPGFENFPFNIVPRGAGQGGQGQAPAAQGGRPRRPAAPPPQAMSSGSGFFISADGYIVTNNHVVENAEEIKVTLKDERELKARVVGRDEGTDLAVLKVEGARLPLRQLRELGQAARRRLGDHRRQPLRPGRHAPRPASSRPTAATSATSPSSTTSRSTRPINRGNSGGPTFDIYGRVIGVNTAIFSPSGGSVGIGFAIPADVADDHHQAADHRRQDHPRLHRRDDPELHAGDRREPRASARARARWSPT